MSKDQNKNAAFPEIRAKRLEQRKIIWLIALFGFMFVAIFGGLLGGVMGFLDARAERELHEGLSSWFLVIGGLLAGFAGLWWSLKYWKAIDEMARRAHLDAFFWGGTVAWIIMVASVYPAIVFPQLQYQVIETIAKSQTHAFALGALTAVIATIAGYTVFWLAWWARKR